MVSRTPPPLNSLAGRQNLPGIQTGFAAAGLILLLVLAAQLLFPLSLGPRVVLEPWLLTEGFALYSDVVDQHEPALPTGVALFVRIGLPPVSAARLVFLLIHIATLSLLYPAAEKLAGRGAGLAALILYGAMTPVIVQGKLWYDMAMAPWLLLSALCLVRDERSGVHGSGWMFLAGLMLGVSFLFKQHTVFVFGAVLAWLVDRIRPRTAAWMRDAALVSAGFVLLPLGHLLWRWRAGTLGDHFHWCWGINDRYLDLALLRPTRLQALEMLPIALLVFFSLTFRSDAKHRLVLALILGGALLAFPRYAHFHLAACFPFLCIAGARFLIEGLNRHGTIAAGMCRAGIPRLLGMALVVLPAIFTTYPWLFIGRGLQVLLEYDNLAPVSALIRARQPEGRTMVVFPADEATSNLHVLAGRLPPGYWLLTYPWYIESRVEDRLIDGLGKTDLVVIFPGRELQGNLPETYMNRYYRAILEQFPHEEPFEWAQGRGVLRFRVAPTVDPDSVTTPP